MWEHRVHSCVCCNTSMLNYKDFVLFKQHPWHLGNISSRISRHTMSWKVNVSLFPPKLSNSASSWVPWEWINCKMLSFWCCFRGTLCPFCRNTNTGKWWVCLYQMYWGGQDLWGQLLPPVEMFHAPQLMFRLYLPFNTIIYIYLPKCQPQVMTWFTSTSYSGSYSGILPY